MGGHALMKARQAADHSQFMPTHALTSQNTATNV